MANGIYSLGATRISVGLSAIVKVSSTAFEFGHALKIFSGGGTLEILPVPVALSGSSAAGWGTGYPVGASEIVSFNGPATYYLAASGATMIASVMLGRTDGYSLL